MLLTGKVVIISGIGPGLGVKLALESAREGAEGVVVAARTPSKLNDAEERIFAISKTCKVLKVAVDITDPAECECLVKEAIGAFGRIDVLINSAFCYGSEESLETVSMESCKEVFDTNVFGSLQLTQQVIPEMRRLGGGSILFINTQAIRRPSRSGIYAASKGALRVLAMYLAKELGQFGIRVNTLLPGLMWGRPVEEFVMRDAGDKGISEGQIIKKLSENMALRRIVSDDEVARAAMLLVSDYASAVTGALLDANGGEFLP